MYTEKYNFSKKPNAIGIAAIATAAIRWKGFPPLGVSSNVEGRSQDSKPRFVKPIEINCPLDIPWMI